MKAEEKIGFQIANPRKAMEYLGEVYRDPKDAINEFVSNAWDEYSEAGVSNAHIIIKLQRSGKRASVMISDYGRGMSRERLRQLPKEICESEKALSKKATTIGEKGIGILGYRAIGKQLRLISRAKGSSETCILTLDTDESKASLIRATGAQRRDLSGTDAVISGISKENFRLITVPKLEKYFKERLRSALLRGQYKIQLCEGKRGYFLQPERYKGQSLLLNPFPTPWGKIEFNLYLSPSDKKDRKIALVGAGGTTIVNDVTELDDFNEFPWNSNHIEGEILFPALQQATGRKSIVRDRKKYPHLVSALEKIKPIVSRDIEELRSKKERETQEKVFSLARKIFQDVIRELEDVDIPTKGPVLASDGILAPGKATGIDLEIQSEKGKDKGGEPSSKKIVDEDLPGKTRQKRVSMANIINKTFDVDEAYLRSKFVKAERTIYLNEDHDDYHEERKNERRRLNYVLMLLAKEYALFNKDREGTNSVAEEAVRFLVRARRLIPEDMK